MSEPKSISLPTNLQWTRKEIIMTSLQGVIGTTLVALAIFASVHMAQHNMYTTPGHMGYVTQSNFWGSWNQPVWVPEHIDLAALLGSVGGQLAGYCIGGSLLFTTSLDIFDKTQKQKTRRATETELHTF